MRFSQLVTMSGIPLRKDLDTLASLLEVQSSQNTAWLTGEEVGNDGYMLSMCHHYLKLWGTKMFKF